MTEPIPDSEFVEPPLFATADDVQFWEPWTANSPLMRPTPAGSFVSRADYDRLREERDRWRERARSFDGDRVEARALATQLAEALRDFGVCPMDCCTDESPCPRCAALAVFDAKEKPDG